MRAAGGDNLKEERGRESQRRERGEVQGIMLIDEEEPALEDRRRSSRALEKWEKERGECQ